MKEWARYSYEKSLQKEGYLIVAGIDEVGRGCLAGPLVASAVVLPVNCKLKLYDSKQITAQKRLDLSDEVIKNAVGCGIGWVTNIEIDEFGLAWACMVWLGHLQHWLDKFTSMKKFRYLCGVRRRGLLR